MLDRTEQPIFHTWEPDDPQSWRPSMKVWANGPGQDRHLAILPEKEIRIVKVKKSDLPELEIRIDPCQDRHLFATLLERQIRNHTYHLFVKLINELFICLFVRFSKLRRRPLLSAIVGPPTNIECMQQPGRGKVQCFKFSWSLVVRMMMRLMAMVAMPMIGLFLADTQWHVLNPVEAPSSCILQHILSTSFIIMIMV